MFLSSVSKKKQYRLFSLTTRKRFATPNKTILSGKKLDKLTKLIIRGKYSLSTPVNLSREASVLHPADKHILEISNNRPQHRIFKTDEITNYKFYNPNKPSYFFLHSTGNDAAIRGLIKITSGLKSKKARKSHFHAHQKHYKTEFLWQPNDTYSKIEVLPTSLFRLRRLSSFETHQPQGLKSTFSRFSRLQRRHLLLRLFFLKSLRRFTSKLRLSNNSSARLDNVVISQRELYQLPIGLDAKLPSQAQAKTSQGAEILSRHTQLLFSYVLKYARSEKIIGLQLPNANTILPSYQPYAKNLIHSYLTLPNTWFMKLENLSNLYTTILSIPEWDIYSSLKQAKVKRVAHFLRLTFKSHRLVICLTSEGVKHTHFAIWPGAFIKFFNNRKSLKKKLALKLLMARFLRKLLLVLALKHVEVLTRGVPLQVEPFLKTLFKPLSHAFTNPLTSEILDETSTPLSRLIELRAITFLHFKPFGYQKSRKKGRVKRKIRRKLFRNGSILD